MSVSDSACWRTIGVYGGDHRCERLVEAVHCRNCAVFHQAARGVFARPAPPEPAQTAQDAEAGGAQRAALVFRIGAHWLGIGTGRLAEVAANRPVRRLAHRTASRLEGAVNVRGELHLCVSLAELLGLALRDDARDERARLILLRDGTGALLAFRCDEVRGLQHYRGEDAHAAPDTLAPALRRCVLGLLDPEGDAGIALLDEEAVVNALEEALFQ